MTAPQRGDVVEVGPGEPDHAPGTPPDPEARVRIRLHDYPATFVVRVEATDTGPVVAALTIEPDPGHAVDVALLRSIPARRLAHSAADWHHRAGGLLAFPDDGPAAHTRPEAVEDVPDRVVRAARIARAAVSEGKSVREAIASQLNVSKPTADRIIRAAKDAGLIDPADLPKKPGPRQRDLTV
ncbi:hypothetical protein P0W64_15095 [Tsukamurella sp. 8F]|uniref:hypothetical protein n=1 Tax=unclassified Tsukamurella TaxID=2633480 RepID=UPI0023B8B880|nr:MULTISPECIES: hypothetical protein [unclassified Tsukamurella]MDF0532534.1 hypothetical protein [Tsukamurella sp. 8J]MDF0588104.1 hypothetical protein [Tsukamurella sp. 8F]